MWDVICRIGAVFQKGGELLGLGGLLGNSSSDNIALPLLLGLGVSLVLTMLAVDSNTMDLLLLVDGCNIPGGDMGKSRGLFVVVVGKVTSLSGEVDLVVSRPNFVGVLLADDCPDKIAHSAPWC